MARNAPWHAPFCTFDLGFGNFDPELSLEIESPNGWHASKWPNLVKIGYGWWKSPTTEAAHWPTAPPQVKIKRFWYSIDMFPLKVVVGEKLFYWHFWQKIKFKWREYENKSWQQQIDLERPRRSGQPPVNVIDTVLLNNIAICKLLNIVP